MSNGFVKAVLAVIAGIALQSCGGSGSSSGTATNLPLITPPVRAAAPKSFGGSNSGANSMMLFTPASESVEVGRARYTDKDGSVHILNGMIDPGDFNTRFFASGPTDIWGILSGIDSRISDINSMPATTNAACVNQAPVSYNITPYDKTVLMYAQCYQSIGTNGFVQWGVHKGITYLWVQVGAGNEAAIATPVSSTGVPDPTGASGQYQVQAWATVGNAGSYNSNGTTSANFDTIGSYGVMQVQANSALSTFEMTAAGIGMGYCGAQFVSDGVNIYGAGSVDMGSTCQTDDTICVSAADGTTPETCTTSEQIFSLPSIGRIGFTSPDLASTTYGSSEYPATPNVLLDGTSMDSLAFGPTTPTPGVGQFGGSSN